MARVRKKGKNERDRKAKQEEDRDKARYEQTIHEQTMHEQTMHDQIAYVQNQNRKNVIWYVLAGCVLEIVLEVFASSTVFSLLMGGGVAVLGGSVSFIASHAKPSRDKYRTPRNRCLKKREPDLCGRETCRTDLAGCMLPLSPGRSLLCGLPLPAVCHIPGSVPCGWSSFKAQLFSVYYADEKGRGGGSAGFQSEGGV